MTRHSSERVEGCYDGDAVTVADLDRDGRLDLLCSSAIFYWTVMFAVADRVGADLPRTLKVRREGLGGNLIADFDADGWPEVVLADDAGGADRSSDVLLGGPGGRGDHGAIDLPTARGGDVTITDPGNVRDRKDRYFYDAPVVDAGGPALWGRVEREASVPAHTSIAFQVRSCEDGDALAGRPWAGPGGVPGAWWEGSSADLGAGHDGARYLQVRVRLARQRSVYGPVLESVSVAYTPLAEAAACVVDADAPCETCGATRPTGLFRARSVVSGVRSDSDRVAEVHALAALPAGGHAVAGALQTEAGGHRDAFVLSLDRFGRERWRWAVGAPDADELTRLAALLGGALVAGGQRTDGDGEPCPWLVGFSRDGALSWEGCPLEDTSGEVLYLAPRSEEVVALASRLRPDDRYEVVVWSPGAGGEPIGEVVVLPGNYAAVHAAQVAWLDDEDRLVVLVVTEEAGEGRRAVRFRTTPGGLELWRSATDAFADLHQRFAGQLPTGDLLFGGWAQPGEPSSRQCRLERLRGGGALRSRGGPQGSPAQRGVSGAPSGGEAQADASGPRGT